MSEATETLTQGAPAENDAKEQRMFTQEEFEAELGKRVFRERNKYADYEELKAKAAKFDEAEEASKSELQKAVEERDKLASKLKALEDEKAHAEAVAKAAAEHGVDAGLLSRMAGDVEENAQFLKQQMADAPKYRAVQDGGEAGSPINVKSNAERFSDQLFGNQ